MIFLSQACCASKAKKREGMEVWKWFKGRTIKIDFPKQTNRLMYNSDISPVTQRRVWRATNHRNWQSGLHWYNKQVQIPLMNIRERGNGGSIRREKDSSEWAKSIKYSSSNLCTLSSTNDTRAFKKHLWEKSSRTHRRQRRDGVAPLLLSLYFAATSTGSRLWPRERARGACSCQGPKSRCGDRTKIRGAPAAKFLCNLGLWARRVKTDEPRQRNSLDT